MPVAVKNMWAGLIPIGLAAGLAGWSLNFGLPFLFRPDEDVMVGRAVRMAAEGSLDPLFANYPPLVFYLFAAVEKASGQLGGAAGADPSGAYLAARSVSALAATMTAGFVFIAARRAYGAPAGLLAAVLVAVAPLGVRQAHFATTDSVQTVFVAAAVLAALTAGGRRGFALAGALSGLAAASKYTGGAVVLVPLLLALQGPDRRGSAIATAAGAAAAFALPSLVMLGHLGAYASGLGFVGSRAYGGGSLPIGWIYHATVTLPFGLGLGGFALAVAGIGVALWRHSAADAALLTFAAAYYAVTGAGHEDFFRYMLPLLPALAILAGGALRAFPGSRLAPALVAGLLLLLPGAYASVQTDRLLGTTDSRALAAAWLDANTPAGTRLSTPYYGGPFYDRSTIAQNRRNVDDALAAGFLQGRYSDRFVLGSSDPELTLLASRPPRQAPLPDSHEVKRLFTVVAGDDGAVYDQLDSFYLPIWGFERIRRPGPSLEIVPGRG